MPGLQDYYQALRQEESPLAAGSSAEEFETRWKDDIGGLYLSVKEAHPDFDVDEQTFTSKFQDPAPEVPANEFATPAPDSPLANQFTEGRGPLTNEANQQAIRQEVTAPIEAPGPDPFTLPGQLTQAGKPTTAEQAENQTVGILGQVQQKRPRDLFGRPTKDLDKVEEPDFVAVDGTESPFLLGAKQANTQERLEALYPEGSQEGIYEEGVRAINIGQRQIAKNIKAMAEIVDAHYGEGTFAQKSTKHAQLVNEVLQDPENREKITALQLFESDNKTLIEDPAYQQAAKQMAVEARGSQEIRQLIRDTPDYQKERRYLEALQKLKDVEGLAVTPIAGLGQLATGQQWLAGALARAGKSVGAITRSQSLMAASRKLEREYAPPSNLTRDPIEYTIKLPNGKTAAVDPETQEIRYVLREDGTKDDDYQISDQDSEHAKNTTPDRAYNGASLAWQTASVIGDLAIDIGVTMGTGGIVGAGLRSARTGMAVGQFISPALRVQYQALEDAVNAGASADEAFADQALMGIAYGLSSYINPLESQIAGRLVGHGSNSAMRKINQYAAGQISASDLTKHVTGGILRSGGKEVLEEHFEQEVLENIVNASLNNTLGGEREVGMSTGDELITTSIVAGAVGILGGSGNVNWSKSGMAKDAITTMLDRPELAEAMIEGIRAKDPEEATRKEIMLQAVLQDYKNANVPESKRKELAGLLVTSYNLADQIAQHDADSPVAQAGEERLSRLNEQIKRIVEPELFAQDPEKPDETVLPEDQEEQEEETDIQVNPEVAGLSNKELAAQLLFEQNGTDATPLEPTPAAREAAARGLDTKDLIAQAAGEQPLLGQELGSIAAALADGAELTPEQQTTYAANKETVDLAIQSPPKIGDTVKIGEGKNAREFTFDAEGWKFSPTKDTQIPVPKSGLRSVQAAFYQKQRRAALPVAPTPAPAAGTSITSGGVTYTTTGETTESGNFVVDTPDGSIEVSPQSVLGQSLAKTKPGIEVLRARINAVNTGMLQALAAGDSTEVLETERDGISREIGAEKARTGRPVEDPAREEEMLNDLVVRGAELGVPEETVRDYFGKQIQRSKDIQQAARGTGEATVGFFSDVTTGRKGKSNVPYRRVLRFGKGRLIAKLDKIIAKYRGNFDDHIAKSIPGHREVQAATAAAVVTVMGEGKVLDIGGSENSWAKAVAEASNGSLQTTTLDPNPDMAAFSEKTPVEGNRYVQEAFREGFTMDDGVEVPAWSPDGPYDVVHESMTFQFISNDREGQVAYLKENVMAPEGVFITEEKFHEPTEAWKQREEAKDKYKRRYFPQKEITQKADEVLFGMHNNQVARDQYQAILEKHFKYVTPYYAAGNFGGFIATDSKANHDQMVAELHQDIPQKDLLASQPVKKPKERKETPPVKIQPKAEEKLPKNNRPPLSSLVHKPGPPPKQGLQAQATKALESLKSMGADVKVVIYDAIQDVPAGRRKYVPGSRGFMVKNDGKYTIYISAKLANPYTVFHEAAHVAFDLFVGQNDVEKAKAIHTTLYGVLKNGTKEEKALADRIQELSKQYEKGVQSEEFFAELVGVLAASRQSITKPKAQAIAKALNDFLSKLFNRTIRLFPEDATVGDLVDFVNVLAGNLSAGEMVVMTEASKLGLTLQPKGDSGVRQAQIPSLEDIAQTPADLIIQDPVIARMNKMDTYRQAASAAIDSRADFTGGDRQVVERSMEVDDEMVRQQAIFTSNGIMEAAHMARIVAHVDTRYLHHVMHHIQSQREKMMAGELPLRDLTKSYLIAVMSQGASATPIKSYEKSIGIQVPEIYTEDGKIRPEGATAFVLTETEAGRRLLDEVDAGSVTQTTAEDFMRLMGHFGKASTFDLADPAAVNKATRFFHLFGETKKGQVNLQNFATEMEEVRNGTAMKEGRHHESLRRLKGIGPGKTGFMGHFFGIGDRGVIDVREITLWLYANEVSDKSKKEIEKELTTPRGNDLQPLQKEFLDRIAQVGAAAGFPEDVAAYMAHHLLWGFVKGEFTHHAGLYYAFSGTEDLYRESIERVETNRVHLRRALDTEYSPDLDMYATAQLTEMARTAKEEGRTMGQQIKLQKKAKSSFNIWEKSSILPTLDLEKTVDESTFQSLEAHTYSMLQGIEPSAREAAVRADVATQQSVRHMKKKC